MIIYIEAQYKLQAGTALDPDYYPKGATQRLAIKTRVFSNKVTIYRVRGYYDMTIPATRVDYRDMVAFLDDWAYTLPVEEKA